MSLALPELEPAVPQLASTDYDGTVSLTSEGGPGIKTVNEGYAIGIDEKFGPKAADRFIEGGGHNHRTVPEIVKDIAPDLSNVEVERIAQEITEIKLAVLCDQIGTSLPGGGTWPRFTDGFAEAWTSIYENRSEERVVDTAVLSAGHKSFILATFDEKGLPHPDIFISDEELIEMGFGGFGPELRAKPSPLMMFVAEDIWRRKNGLLLPLNPAERYKQIKYIGDDPSKDHNFAKNAGVDFEILDPAYSRATWQRFAAWTGLGSAAIRTQHGK